MTHNLFDNAKFGDMFLTTENKQAVFLRFAENAEYKFAFLYVEDWGNVQVFRHNGKEIYNDAAHSIISKQEEPVSKDLEEATNNYCLNARKGYPRVKDETDRYICSAFKAGSNWKKQQMMKDAVDGWVFRDIKDGKLRISDNKECWNGIRIPEKSIEKSYLFCTTDDAIKVKLVIVKED